MERHSGSQHKASSWIKPELTEVILPRFRHSAASPLFNSALEEIGLVKNGTSTQPGLPYSVQSGDIHLDNLTGLASVVILAHSDRPAKMQVALSRHPDFRASDIYQGPIALPENGYSSKLLISHLPGGNWFYRVRFQDIANDKLHSDYVLGQFWVPGMTPQDIKLIFTGDTVGQGFGIRTNVTHEQNGMVGYKAIINQTPNLFIHLGDGIYSDIPVPDKLTLPDGTTWQNLTTPGKSQVAQTVDQFRDHWRYNGLDQYERLLRATTATIAMIDDHDVHPNNGFPGETLDDSRYQETSVSVLMQNGLKAFHEFNPTHRSSSDSNRIYRRSNLGPNVELFVTDMRQYRGSNFDTLGEQKSLFGQTQIDWLKSGLLESNSVWKIIAIDMPIGLIVRDGETGFDNMANGDGLPHGRELEFAGVLKFIKDQAIKNVIFVTADVHYAAVHYYNPEVATFKNFNAFYEIVCGPIHAGAFGANHLDNTFGPQVLFQSRSVDAPQGEAPNLHNQFFSVFEILKDGQLHIAIKDISGQEVKSLTLEPDSKSSSSSC